jgi:uncharacterized protein DUF3617
MSSFTRHAALLVAIFLPLAAGAADAPKRKSGLWEVVITSPQMGNRAMTIQECVDQKTDDMMEMDESMGEEMKCSKPNVLNEGGRLVVDAVCKVGKSTARARTVFSGSFDSAYKADVKAIYDPPLEGLREATQVIEGKWLGPCKPGQKPGEVVIPGMPNKQDDTKGMPKK